jgi:hypothetical protein
MPKINEVQRDYGSILTTHMIRAFEREKTVHTLDGAATVISN